MGARASANAVQCTVVHCGIIARFAERFLIWSRSRAPTPPPVASPYKVRPQSNNIVQSIIYTVHREGFFYQPSKCRYLKVLKTSPGLVSRRGNDKYLLAHATLSSSERPVSNSVKRQVSKQPFFAVDLRRLAISCPKVNGRRVHNMYRSRLRDVTNASTSASTLSESTKACTLMGRLNAGQSAEAISVPAGSPTAGTRELIVLIPNVQGSDAEVAGSRPCPCIVTKAIVTPLETRVSGGQGLCFQPESSSSFDSGLYNNLLRVEQEFKIHNEVCANQIDVTATMRSTLVDWLVEVAEEYSLVPDTLFLSIALVDRVLDVVRVPRKSLQLLGVACTLIAAKFEEIYAPNVSELCYITDNTYSSDQIIDMERSILKYLEFRVYQPTPRTFLDLFISCGDFEREIQYCSGYLCELVLLDGKFVEHTSSVIAASALIVSAVLVSNDQNELHISHLLHVGSFACASKIISVARSVDRSSAVYEKYLKVELCEAVKTPHGMAGLVQRVRACFASL